ncbi:MAG: ATP synthase F1 subunit gamma [Marinilabiliales bacterium]|nr:MAG: ATP synthase F1 subunit gamma [Marinilabiliales bacterium]
MANLKEVRIRIASVNNTKQLTTAMKLVSASKLRKAQNNIQKLRPYAGKLKEIMNRISASMDELPEGGVFDVRKPEKILCVVYSSNKGLCGAFNSNLGKHLKAFVETEYPEQLKAGNIDYYSVGSKVPVFMKKYGVVFSKAYNDLIDKPNYEDLEKLASELIQEYIDSRYDAIHLFYNEFKNAATQRPIEETFLPFEMSDDEGGVAETDYLMEPEEEEMFKTLVPKTLKIQMFKALLDSVASEHGARMTAMHKATDNATELLKELKLSYNKARQAAITNEIIEIVSGAEALKG